MVARSNMSHRTSKAGPSQQARTYRKIATTALLALVLASYGVNGRPLLVSRQDDTTGALAATSSSFAEASSTATSAVAAEATAATAPSVPEAAPPGFASVSQPQMSNADVYSVGIPPPPPASDPAAPSAPADQVANLAAAAPQPSSQQADAAAPTPQGTMQELASLALSQINSTSTAPASGPDTTVPQVAAASPSLPASDGPAAQAAFYDKTVAAMNAGAVDASAQPEATSGLLSGAAVDASVPSEATSGLAGNPDQGSQYQQMIADQRLEFAPAPAPIDPAQAAANVARSRILSRRGLERRQDAAPAAPADAAAPVDAQAPPAAPAPDAGAAPDVGQASPAPSDAVAPAPAAPSDLAATTTAAAAELPAPSASAAESAVPSATVESDTAAATVTSAAASTPAAAAETVPVAPPIDPATVQDGVVPPPPAAESSIATLLTSTPTEAVAAATSVAADATTVQPSSLSVPTGTPTTVASKDGETAEDFTLTFTIPSEPTGSASTTKTQSDDGFEEDVPNGSLLLAPSPSQSQEIEWQTMTVLIPADALRPTPTSTSNKDEDDEEDGINLASLSSLLSTPTAAPIPSSSLGIDATGSATAKGTGSPDFPEASSIATTSDADAPVKSLVNEVGAAKPTPTPSVFTTAIPMTAVVNGSTFTRTVTLTLTDTGLAASAQPTATSTASAGGKDTDADADPDTVAEDDLPPLLRSSASSSSAAPTPTSPASAKSDAEDDADLEECDEDEDFDLDGDATDSASAARQQNALLDGLFDYDGGADPEVPVDENQYLLAQASDSDSDWKKEDEGWLGWLGLRR